MLKTLTKIVNVVAAGYVIYFGASLFYQMGKNDVAKDKDTDGNEYITIDGVKYQRVK